MEKNAKDKKKTLNKNKSLHTSTSELHSKTVKELQEIYQIIEEEIQTVIVQNEKICLMGDFNCKVGLHIPMNTNKVTKGGRILLKMANKYNLSILNGEDCCRGTWT